MRTVSPARFAKMAWECRKRGGTSRLPDLRVVRSFITKLDVVADADSTRQLRYTITTDAVDRMQDVISADGWDLKSYLQNPVVLWGHDHDLVIGKAIDISRTGNGLDATVQFQPSDMPIVGPWADYAFRSGVTGFIRATSVGFRPLEWDFTEDEERGGDDWFPGIDFQRQELTEFSVVSVPANPEALLASGVTAPDAGGKSLENPGTQPIPTSIAVARAHLRATRARRFALPA